MAIAQTKPLGQYLNPLGQFMKPVSPLEASQSFKGMSQEKSQQVASEPYNYLTAPSPFTKENAPITTGALTGAGTGSEMKAPLPTVQAPPTTQVSSMSGRKNIPTKTEPIIPVASAGESLDTNIAQQAISDIHAGMPMDQFDTVYPELKQNRGLFEQYEMDVKAGMPQEEGIKMYPELFGQAPASTAPSEVPKEEGMLDSMKFKSSEEFGVAEGAKDVLKFFANVPADSAQVVSGIWDAVTSPVQTTTGLVKTAKGLSDKAVYATLNGIARQFGSKDVSPTQEAEMIDQMATGIKEKYGTLGKFKKAMVENPADTLITFMPILGGVSKVAKANGFIETANKIDKLQSVINPVNVLKQEAKLATAPIKGAVKLTGEVLGKTTGTSGETIRKAVELGGTPEFKSALRGKTTPQDILASTKEGLQAIKDNRSKLYGEDYVKLQANKTPINIDDIAQNFAKTLQDDYKIKMGDKGLDFSQSKITGGTSQSQIQSMFDDIQNWKDTTPEGLDVLKQRLQDYFRGTPDSSKGDRLSTIASNAVKDKIVQAVPEYAQMTDKFEKLTNDIRDITKTLSLNDKAQAQTAITKLNGVLRDNFPARQDMIKIIEQYTGKNLQGQIAGASLNAPLAKGLAGVISAGGIMTGQLANPAFWAGLAVASPRLIGEMASIIGTTTEKVTQAINNIKKYVPTSTIAPVNTLEGVPKAPVKEGIKIQEVKKPLINLAEEKAKAGIKKAPVLKSKQKK